MLVIERRDRYGSAYKAAVRHEKFHWLDLHVLIVDVNMDLFQHSFVVLDLMRPIFFVETLIFRTRVIPGLFHVRAEVDSPALLVQCFVECTVVLWT